MSKPYFSAEFLKSTGLASLSAEQVNRSALVLEVSPNATLKNVEDFFSFCGSIEKIIQEFNPNQQGKQFAVIVFDDENSFSTALLLGNATIVDSPIQVVPYAKIAPKSGNASAIPTGPEIDLPYDRTASAVVASLVAKGYITGEGVISQIKAQAAQLDKQAQFTNRAKVALNFSQQKFQEIDDQLNLTNTLNTIKTGVSAGVNTVNTTVKTVTADIEAKLHIKENLDLAAKTVREGTIKTANDIRQKAMEIEPLKQGITWMDSFFTTLKDTVNTQSQKIKDQVTGFASDTKNEITKQKSKQQLDPFGDDPVPTDSNNDQFLSESSSSSQPQQSSSNQKKDENLISF